MSQKKSAVEEEVSMDMTPMIDVTFQLLIFFIITLKFKLLERKLNSHLPTDFGSRAESIPINEIFVTVKLRQVHQNGLPLRNRRTRIMLENEVISTAAGESSLDEVKARLGRFLHQHRDATGKIDVGEGVPHKAVIEVLDLFNQCGYKTVTFVGMPKSKTLADARVWWQKTRARLSDG